MTQSGHRYCNAPKEGTFCLGQKSAERTASGGGKLFHDGLPPRLLVSDTESHGDVCF
jgi:hypothetical protein